MRHRRPDVRFGSKGDIGTVPIHVRFTPRKQALAKRAAMPVKCQKGFESSALFSKKLSISFSGTEKRIISMLLVGQGLEGTQSQWRILQCRICNALPDFF